MTSNREQNWKSQQIFLRSICIHLECGVIKFSDLFSQKAKPKNLINTIQTLLLLS